MVMYQTLQGKRQPDRLAQLNLQQAVWKVHYAYATSTSQRDMATTALDAISYERAAVEMLVHGPLSVQMYEMVLEHLTVSARCWNMVLRVLESTDAEDQCQVRASCKAATVDYGRTVYVVKVQRQRVLKTLASVAQKQMVLIEQVSEVAVGQPSQHREHTMHFRKVS